MANVYIIKELSNICSNSTIHVYQKLHYQYFDSFEDAKKYMDKEIEDSLGFYRCISDDRKVDIREACDGGVKGIFLTFNGETKAVEYHILKLESRKELV